MKKEEIIKENEDIFTGIGKIAKEYHIELTSGEPLMPSNSHCARS